MKIGQQMAKLQATV